MAHPAGSSLASTDGPPGNPQHNDVVHKGLWALTAAPIAVQLARSSPGASGRHAKLAERAGPAATQFFCSVRYKYIAVANRAVLQCARPKVTFRLLGTRKQPYGGYF
jgi:hypothetical protein